MTSYQVLVDSDAFVAWSLPDDLFHAQVQETFTKLALKNTGLVTTSWVVAETATVLSSRAGQATARAFLQLLEEMRLPKIHMSEELEDETADFFRAQEARGTSMVDCSNVVIMRRFEIPEILSFDKFYKYAHLQMINH